MSELTKDQDVGKVAASLRPREQVVLDRDDVIMFAKWLGELEHKREELWQIENALARARAAKM